MALYIPPEHAEAFAGLTGSQWPEADEDRLRALAEQYQDLAGELESLQTHLHEFVNAIKNSTEGEFAKAFGEYANQYITPGKEGQIPLETAVKGARGMYKYLRNVAAQVEYMKIQAIAQLIFMAIEIAIAIALAVPTGGLSLLKIASIRALAQAVLRLLMQLLIATIISLAMETIFAAILDAATQQWQIDQGLRDGWDQDLTDAAMKGAAISGALGGIASLGAQALGKTLTKLLGKAFNSKFMNKIAPFNKIGSKLQDFDDFLGKGVKDAFGEQNAKFGAGMASTTKNFSTYMMTGFGNPKIANFSGIKGLGKLSAGAGFNFKNQLGEVFAKNFGEKFAEKLGENAGKQQAKELGEQVAEKITKNIGKNPVHVLSKDLDEVLAPYQKELGKETVESLVKKYPEALQKAVNDHHKPGKLFMLGTSVLGSPVHGAHGVLSEGFNNLFFGDEKEFKVSWYSFTGGAVMGAAESLGEQFVGDPLSDKLKQAVWGPPGMSTADGATGANVPTESDATKLGGSPTGGNQPPGGDTSNGNGSTSANTSSTEHNSAAEDDAIQWWMADTESSSESLGEFPSSTGSQHSAPEGVLTETGPVDDRDSSPDDFDGDVLELDEHGNRGTNVQQSEVQGNDHQAVTTPSGVAPPTQVQTTAGPQPNQGTTPNTQVTPKAGGPSTSLHNSAPPDFSAQTSPNTENTQAQPVPQLTTSVPESGSAPSTDNGSPNQPNTNVDDQRRPTPVVTSSEPNTYSAQTDTAQTDTAQIHSTELPDANNPNPVEPTPEQQNVDEWQEDPGKPRFVPPEEHEQFQRNTLNIDLLGTTPDERAALNDELGAADDVPATTSLLDNGMFIAEQDSNPDTVLEQDLFGLLDPAPSFVPTGDYGPGFENLTAQQGVHLLEKLDLAHAAPRDPDRLDFAPQIPPGLAAEELVGSPVPVSVYRPDAQQQWAPANVTPLPKQLEMPHLRHSIWLGGPITDRSSAATGKATMMANLERSAKALGAHGKVVLWTDVPRDQFAKPPTHAVREMKTWAQENGVILANVDEVFNAAAPMKLQQPFQSEMVKQTKAGYAAASDILRMELLKRFGGVYSDGEYRTGKDYFAEAAQVATSGPGYGVHVLDNGNAGNDLFVMGKGHPFADFYLDHLGANYLKTQSELIPQFQQNHDAEAGPGPYHDYALNIFPARRHIVMFQTGPNAMEAMAAELGLGGVKGFPQSPSDAMRSGSSWTKPESAGPAIGADDLPASIALTKNVVQTLVKELHSRDGDLHLTLVNELVSKHERPDIIWTAALGYLASHPELANLVTSVTDVTTVSDKDGGFHEEQVELPPQALKLLRFGPGDRTHSLAEFSRPATMVQPDAASTQQAETSPLTFFDGEDTATPNQSADAPGSSHQSSVEKSAGEQLADFDDVQPVEEFLKDFGKFSDAPKLEVPEHGAGDLRKNFQQALDLLQRLPPEVPTSLVRDGFIAARNTRLLRMFDVVPGPGGGLNREEAAEQLAGKVVQKLPFTNSVAVNSLRDQFAHLINNRGEMGFLQDLSQGKLFMVDTQELTADGVETVQKDIVLTLDFTGLHQAEADTNVQQKSVTESSTKFEQSVENARKTAFNGVIGAALGAAQAVIGVTPTLTTGGERGNKYGSRYSDDVSGTMKISSAKKTFDVDAVLHWEELTKSGDTGSTGQVPFGSSLVAYPKENVGPAVDAVRNSTPSRADAVDLPTKLTELVAAIDMVKLGDLHKHVLSNVPDSVRQDKVLWHNLSDSINAGKFEEASAHSLPHGFSITHKSEHGRLLPKFRFWQSTKPAEVTAHFKPKFRGYEDLGPFTGSIGTDSRSTLEDLQESSTTMGAEPGIRVGGAGEILPNVQIAPTAHIGAGATSKHTDTNKVAWSDKQKLLEAGPPMRLVRLDASFQVDLETREFGATKTVAKDLGESRDGAYYVTVEESKYQALVDELDAALANQKPRPAEPTPKPEPDPQRKKALSDAVSNGGLVSGLKYIDQADQVFDKTLDLITGHLRKQGVELTAADLRDLKRQLSALNARDLAAGFNRFTHPDGELPDQPLKLTVDHGKRHYQITVDGVLGDVLAEHKKDNLVSTGTSSYSTGWRERDKNTIGIRGTLSALVRARLSSEGYGRPNYVGAGVTAQVKGEVHKLGGHLSAFGHEDKVKYTGPGSIVERGVRFEVQVEETLDVSLGDRLKKAVTKPGDLVAVAQSQIKTDLGKVQVDAVTGHQVPDFLIDAQSELTGGDPLHGGALQEHLQQNPKELHGGVLVWSPDHYQQLNGEFKDLQTKLGNDSKLWLTKEYANAVDLTRQWFDVAQQSAGQGPQTRNLGSERGYLFDRRGAGSIEFKYFNPTPLPVVEGMTWQHVNTSEKSVHEGEGAGIAGDAGISVLFGAGEFGMSAGYQADRGDRDTHSGAGKVTSAPTPSPVLLYKADQLATMSWATWQELWGQSGNHGADVAPKLVKATQDHVEVLFPNSSVVAVTAEQAVAQGLPLPEDWQPPTVEPVARPGGVPVLNGLGHGLDKDVKVLDFSLQDEKNLADRVTEKIEKHFSKLAPPTAVNAQTSTEPAVGSTKPSAFGAILRANGLNGLNSTGVVQQILKGGWEHSFTRGNFFSGSTRYTVKVTFEPDGNPVQLVHHPVADPGDNPVPPVEKPTGGSAETSGSSAVEHQGARSVKFTVGGIARPMIPSGSGSTGPAVVAGGHLSDGVEVSNTVTDNYQHRSRTGDAAQFEQPGKFKIELIKVSKPALLVSELTNGHAGGERFRNPDSRTVHTDAFAGKVRLEVPEGLLNTGTAAQTQGVATQVDPETGKVPGEITDEVRGSSSFNLAKVVPGDLAAKVGALIGKSGHREHSAFSPGTEHRAKLDALLSQDMLLGNPHKFAGPDGHSVKFELPEGTRNEQVKLKVKMRFANPVHDATWDLPAKQQKHDQKRATDYAETEEQAAYAGLGYAALQPPANNNAAIQLNYKGAGRGGDQSTFKLEGNEKASKATLERFHSDVVYEIEVHKQLRGGGWTKVGGETLLYEKSAAFDVDSADAVKFRPQQPNGTGGPANGVTFWDGAGDSPTSTDIPPNADELTGGDPEYAAYVANLLELADAETPEAFDALVQSLRNSLPQPDALSGSDESLNLSELEFGTPIQAHAQSLRGSSDEQLDESGSQVESVSSSQLAAMDHDIRERLARLHRSVNFDARTPVPLARDNAVTTDAGLVAVGEQSVGDLTAAGEKLVGMIVGAVDGSLVRPLTQAEQAALDALPAHLTKLAAGDGLNGLLSKKIWLPLGGGRNLSLDLIPNSATHLANLDPGSPVQKTVLETTPSAGASASHAHKTGVNLTGGVIADVAAGGLLYVLPLVNVSGETTNKVGTTQTESNLHVRKTRFTDVFEVGFEVRTTLHQAGADPVAVTGKLPEKLQLAYPAEAVGPESTDAPHLLPPGGQAKPLPAEALTLIANVESYTNLRDFQDTVLTGIANAVPHAGGLIKKHADRLSDAGLMDNYLRGVAAKLSVQVSGVVPKDPNRPAVEQLGPKADAVARYVRNKVANNDHRIDLKTTGELHLTAFQKVSTAEIDAGNTHRNSFGTSSSVTSTGSFLVGVTVRGLQAIESLMDKVHGRKGQVGANFDLRMSSSQSKGVTAGTKAFFKEKSFHTSEATRYRLDLRLDHTTSIEVGGKARPDKPEGSHVISAYVWVRNTDATKFENLLDAAMADAPHRPPLPAPSPLTPERKRDLRTLVGNGRLTDLRHLHGSGQVLGNALSAVRDLLLRDTSLTAEQRLKLYDEAREKLADLDPVKLVRAAHKIGTTSISTEVELNGHTYVVHSDRPPGEAVAEFAEQLAKQDIPLGDQEWLEVLDQLEANQQQRARARDEHAHTVEFDLGGKKVEVSVTGRPKDIRSAEHIEHASLSSTRGTEVSASNSTSNTFSLSGVLNARFRIQHATEGVASRLHFNLNGGGRLTGSANTGSTAGSAAAHEVKAAYRGPAVLLQQDLDLDVKLAVTGKNGVERTYNSTVGTVAEYLVPEFKAAHADELHAGTTEILPAGADLSELGPQLGAGKAVILSSPVVKIKQLLQTYSKDLQLAGAAGQKTSWGNWIDQHKQLPVVRAATAIASKLPFGGGPKFHVPTDPDAFATALAAAEHGPQLLAKGIKPGTWGHYDLVVSESANVKLYGSKVIGEIPPDLLKISSANKLSSNAAFSHGDSIGGGGDLHLGAGGLDGIASYSKSAGTGETSSRSGWWKTTQQVAPGEKLVMVLAHAVVDQQVTAGQHALHSDALNPYPAHGSTLTKSYLLRDSHVLVMTERDANAWLENSFAPPTPGTLRPAPGLADLGKSVSADVTVQDLVAGQPLGQPFVDALAEHAPALVRDGNQVAVELLKHLDHPAVQQKLLNGGETLYLRAAKKWGGRFFGLHVWAEPAPGWKEHQHSMVRPLPGSKAVTENQHSEGEQHMLSSSTSKAGTLAFNVLPGTDDPLVFPGPSAQWGKSSSKSTELSTGFAQQHGSRSERSDTDVEVDVPVTLHYEIKQYSVGSYLYETIAPSFFRKMQATPVPMPEGTGTAPAVAKLRMPEYLLDLPSTGSALRPGGFPEEKQGEDLTAKVRNAKSLQVVKQNLDGVVDLAAEVIGKAAKSGGKVLPAAQRFAGPASPHRMQLEELFSGTAMVSKPQDFMKGEVITSLQLAEKFLASDYVVGLKYKLDKPVLVEQVGTSGGESLQGGVFSSTETTSKSTGLVHGAGEVTMRDIGYISPDVVSGHKHTTTAESNDGIDLQGRTRSGGETRYVYAFDVQYTATAWVVSAFGETNHHQDAVREGGLLLSFTKEEAEAMGLPLPPEPGQGPAPIAGPSRQPVPVAGPSRSPEPVPQNWDASQISDGEPVPDIQQLFVDELNTKPVDDELVQGFIDGEAVHVKASEITAREVRDNNDELFGVSFAKDRDFQDFQKWAAHADSAPTTNYSVPHADLDKVAKEVQNPASAAGYLQTVPWESGRSPFVINAHATDKLFTVTHRDGRTVKLPGASFAKVVKHYGYFAANRDYLLLACSSGKLTEPGGSAYDFQQALAQFDSGAVHAPSGKVGTKLHGSTPSTVLADSGTWNTFGNARPAPTPQQIAPPAPETAPQQESEQPIRWHSDSGQSMENAVFTALTPQAASTNSAEPMDLDPGALQTPPFDGKLNEFLHEKDITGGFVQTEPGITAFRWLDEHPALVLKYGLQPKDASLRKYEGGLSPASIETHVTGLGETQFVSTTTDKNYRHNKRRYRYEIRAPRPGIDIRETFKKRNISWSAASWEQEAAFLGTIAPENIVEVTEVDGTGAPKTVVWSASNGPLAFNPLPLIRDVRPEGPSDETPKNTRKNTAENLAEDLVEAEIRAYKAEHRQAPVLDAQKVAEFRTRYADALRNGRGAEIDLIQQELHQEINGGPTEQLNFWSADDDPAPIEGWGAPTKIKHDGVEIGYFVQDRGRVLLVDRLGAAHLGTRQDLGEEVLLTFGAPPRSEQLFYRPATGEISSTGQSRITLGERKKVTGANKHLEHEIRERWTTPKPMGDEVIQLSSDERWFRTARDDGSVEISAFGVWDTSTFKATVDGSTYNWWSGNEIVAFTRMGEFHPVEPGIKTLTSFAWSSNQPPAAVTEVAVDQIVPRPVVLAEPKFTFRVDRRSPDQILSSAGDPESPGFHPLNPANTTSSGQNISLVEFVATNKSSMFVSTSLASYFKLGAGKWRYWIFAPGGIAVNQTLSFGAKMPHEREIAFAGGVDEKFVVGYEFFGNEPVVVGNVTYQPNEFVLNANVFAGMPPEYAAKAASELIAVEVLAYIQKNSKRNAVAVVDQRTLARFNTPLQEALANQDGTRFNQVLAELREEIARFGTPA
ncbi:scabin-related ADP-ribosyltransferase [Saccharopolyspora kobensis]|uniref:scabin-related ADP-ribosyltransferase n=1 Tax=Saccharopolyspora kobensis TaxID=146035 RepID=UPI001160FCF6|nr:hypothetical protein [Saccharopolyspora kobensis]